MAAAAQNPDPIDSALKEEHAEAKKPYRQILVEEIIEGLHELERPPAGLFLSGFSAGLDIGFSLLLMATVLTMMHGQLPEPWIQLMLANLYSVGFIFVILGRSELFTEHTTLAVLPLIGGRSDWLSVMRLWGIVYISNLLGTAVFAGLAVLVCDSIGVASRESFGEIAHKAYALPAHALFFSAILAGWLMGLVSWLVTAARDTISQIIIVWLVTSVIGIVHLPHAIVGSVEVLAGIFARQATLHDYGHFMLWTTLGNAVGGTVFVALLKYSHATRGENPGGKKRKRS